MVKLLRSAKDVQTLSSFGAPKNHDSFRALDPTGAILLWTCSPSSSPSFPYSFTAWRNQRVRQRRLPRLRPDVAEATETSLSAARRWSVGYRAGPPSIFQDSYQFSSRYTNRDKDHLFLRGKSVYVITESQVRKVSEIPKRHETTTVLPESIQSSERPCS